MEYNKLTPEEERVILYKGTEPPFSGEYDKHYAAGTYVCRRCNANLYKSEDKFDAHCGWPAFDDEIPGAVKRMPDADGHRTEIVCANCGAHLGHVFSGEKLTPKDTRHCVNSLSMKFVPALKTAYFAGGCFWCLEAAFLGIRGVKSVVSGYAGGDKVNPSYQEVSSGLTGHAETVKIEYDPAKVGFEDLLSVLFTIHDPTTLNRQGNDIGTQYRSVVFYQNDEERGITEKFIAKLAMEKIFDRPIVTEVKPLVAFYPAEEYHQDYYAKHPEQAYCHAVIAPKLKKLREKYKKLIV